jgi:hypothetical protein
VRNGYHGPRRWLILLLWVASASPSGCTSGSDRPDDDPRRPEVVVAPRLAPPPARGPIDQDEAVRIAHAHRDPAEVINELDAHRFAFALDEATLAWFDQQGLDPQVLDYLHKRAKVDWGALRGDVDPDTPR